MTEKTIRGAALEHMYAGKMLAEGWGVSIACDPQSPYDFVLVNHTTGQIRFVDVKAESYRKNCPPGWTKKTTRIYRTTSKEQRKFIQNTGLNIEIITEDFDEIIKKTNRG